VFLKEVVCLFPGAVEEFPSPLAHDGEHEFVVIVGFLDDFLDRSGCVEDFPTDGKALSSGEALGTGYLGNEPVASFEGDMLDDGAECWRNLEVPRRNCIRLKTCNSCHVQS
jgi:hypothetical protein